MSRENLGFRVVASSRRIDSNSYSRDRGCAAFRLLNPVSPNRVLAPAVKACPASSASSSLRAAAAKPHRERRDKMQYSTIESPPQRQLLGGSSPGRLQPGHRTGHRSSGARRPSLDQAVARRAHRRAHRSPATLQRSALSRHQRSDALGSGSGRRLQRPDVDGFPPSQRAGRERPQGREGSLVVYAMRCMAGLVKGKSGELLPSC